MVLDYFGYFMLGLSMLTLFLDRDRTQRIDHTGFNKVGYVTQSRYVIFPWRHKLVKEKLSVIEKLPHKLGRLPENLGLENIERFFTENYQSLDLFNLGLSMILKNDAAYFVNPLKLPRLEPIDNRVWNDRWVSLKNMVTTGDMLCIFDTKNLFSWVISKADRGPWSHTAICTGEGTVLEAITSGVCERPLDIYATPHYRVGLYRDKSGLLNQKQKDLLEFGRSQIGKPYSYRTAVIVGIQKLLRMRQSVPTPNDLAITPNFELVAYV
jgi:hypothetical protein